MGDDNLTSWTEFILVGFSDIPQLRVPLLVTALIIYLVTISGNLLVMSVIYSDSHLHTPMYFFLTNLSTVDICYTSIMFPKMLTSFFILNPRITLQECLVEVFFFMGMIATEFSLLTIMSFDRYVAICNPFHYVMIMNKSVCIQLAAGAWIGGLVVPIFNVILFSKFSFCKSHEINHFFCDFTALLKLSCTSNRITEIITIALGSIVVTCSCVPVFSSYVKIISSILKIQTTTQRSKAFSTCSSHLTVVLLFYGVLIFVYLRPASTYSVSQSKIFSLFYSGVLPMCNPIIYTLKNKEFKGALQRIKCRKC